VSTNPSLRRPAAAFLFFFATALIAPIIPTYVVANFGAGGIGVGIAVAAMGLPGLLARPLAGRFVDRRGASAGVAAGGAIGVIAFMGQALAPTLVVFAIFRTFIGLADGFVLVGAARGSDDGRRGRGSAYTRFAALFVAGTAIGPIVAVWISDRWGQRTVFFVAAGCAVAGSMVLGEAAPRARLGRDRNRRSAAPTLRTLLHGPVVTAGLALGLANLGFGAIYGFAVLRGDALGMGSPELLLSAFSATLILGRVVGSSWPDRFGLARTTTSATVLSAVGLVAAGLSPSAVTLTVALVAVGFGYAFIMPAVLAEAAAVAGDQRSGAAVGTVMGLLDLVLTVGTVGLGVVAAQLGQGAVFVICGGVTLAALPLFGWWRLRSAPGEPGPAQPSPATPPPPVPGRRSGRR